VLLVCVRPALDSVSYKGVGYKMCKKQHFRYRPGVAQRVAGS
jgi:hypothetical protein